MDDYSRSLDRKIQSPSLFPLEEEFKKTLKEQQSRMRELQKMVRKMREQASAGKPLDPRSLEELTRELEGMAGRMNRDVEKPAELLSAVSKLLAQADQFVRLTQEQKELTQLLRRFKEHKGSLSRLQQMELQELSVAERRIRDGLKKYLERLPELQKKVPGDEQYRGLQESVETFLQAVREAGIQKDLALSCQKLGNLDGPGSYPAAKSAFEKMDALISKCQGMQGEGKQCLRFQPSLSQAMQSSLAQILSALKSQGMGGNGEGGYGLLGQDVGLYGPDVQLARAGGRGPEQPYTSPRERESDGARSNDTEADLPTVIDPARVRLDRDARFPLRYRDLIGEYFRAVAEKEEQ